MSDTTTPNGTPPSSPLADVDERIVTMVAMLMRGHQVKSIADHFGVSERTVHRWKASDEGRKALAQAKREAVDRAHRAVSTASGAAAQTLTEIATDKRARRGDRVRAAEAILRASGVTELGSLLLVDDGEQVRVAAEATLTAKLAQLEESLRLPGPVEGAPGALKAVGE